jgi:hypothetical protein
MTRNEISNLHMQEMVILIQRQNYNSLIFSNEIKSICNY